jgi:hypothetical protein
MRLSCRYLIVWLVPSLLAGQEKSDLQQILDRLDRLEQENRDLAAEVRSLREELAASRQTQAPAPETVPPAPPLQEQVAVQQRRIEEQAQTKVEASQKLPITLSGMVLFNGFLNGKANGGLQDSTTASLTNNEGVGGGSLSQSIVGLQFQGPHVLGGGQVNGSLYMDLFGGSPTSSLDHLIRLRTASVELDWKNTTLMVGQDKPIISPRDPNSLAQVGVAPLSGAGNLWLWQPQVRLEQRVSFTQQMGLQAQLGVYETGSPFYGALESYGAGYPVSPARPALEGRFEFWRQLSPGARIEIAPGFHTSTSHVNGVSIPSNLFSLDWLIQPFPKLQLTGMFFQGRNAAGLGGLNQGFTIFSDEQIVGIGAAGGWAQLSYLVTNRLSFNLYGGQESDRSADLLTGDIRRNLTYAANVIYHLGPNVLLGLEASQARTNYFLLTNRLNNHYDLAVGYLF